MIKMEAIKIEVTTKFYKCRYSLKKSPWIKIIFNWMNEFCIFVSYKSCYSLLIRPMSK